MYVCKYVQVVLQRPTRTVVSLRHWPPWLAHQGGTAIGWVSSCCLANSGGTRIHMYIYIYICLCPCRCVLLLLRIVDLFGLRALASKRAHQSFCQGSLSCLSALLSAGRAAAAFCSAACAVRMPFASLSLSLCRLLPRSASRDQTPTHHLPRGGTDPA